MIHTDHNGSRVLDMRQTLDYRPSNDRKMKMGIEFVLGVFGLVGFIFSLVALQKVFALEKDLNALKSDLDSELGSD